MFNIIKQDNFAPNSSIFANDYVIVAQKELVLVKISEPIKWQKKLKVLVTMVTSGCERTKLMIEIFADGACRGNPGPGGWGVFLRYQQHEKELYGAAAETTNNRMELTAAIQGLLALKQPSKVTLTTDSKYVIEGITQWVINWQKSNWKTAAKKPVKNVDLWEQLVLAASQHQIDWQWVKGHSGHAENERADALANKAIDELLIANK